MTCRLALIYLVFLLRASPAQQPNSCIEGANLSRMIDQAQKLAPPELLSLPVMPVTFVIAAQQGTPARLVQASFGAIVFKAAQLKNDSKKTILSYRLGWSYVHPDGMEFHKGDLRTLPAGLRPGRTRIVAGEPVAVDPSTQQVILFVAELTFSDRKHGRRRRRISKYGAIESVSLASK